MSVWYGGRQGTFFVALSRARAKNSGRQRKCVNLTMKSANKARSGRAKKRRQRCRLGNIWMRRRKGSPVVPAPPPTHTRELFATPGRKRTRKLVAGKTFTNSPTMSEQHSPRGATPRRSCTSDVPAGDARKGHTELREAMTKRKGAIVFAQFRMCCYDGQMLIRCFSVSRVRFRYRGGMRHQKKHPPSRQTRGRRDVADWRREEK